MKVEKVFSKNKLLAYIVRNIAQINGQKFFSETEDFLQVGVMGLSKDTELKPHYHLPQYKTIDKNQEVLIILSGKIEVTFFDIDSNEKVDSKIVEGGCILVLIDGGHGFRMLEDTQLVEVKQGPYEGQSMDKSYF